MKNTKPWMRYVDDGVEQPGSTDTVDEAVAETDNDTQDDAAIDDAGVQDEEPAVWDAQAALKKIRKVNAENKRLRERTHAAEEKAKTVEETSSLLKARDAENLRLRVALEMNLPEKLAMRLQGETREELLQDAQELMELYETPRPGGGKPRNRVGEGHAQPPSTASKVDLDALAASFRN